MNRRFFVLMFTAGLLVALGAAILETAPGYMDADYYFAGAQRIADGQGSSEPYLWNYLSDPVELPAPSFAYWMPLTSMISAVGIRLLPGDNWWGARVPLILLAGLIPPLAALLSWRLTNHSRHAHLAGILALLPGFYLAYLPATDVFAIEMVLGGLFFWLVGPGPGANAGDNKSVQSQTLRLFGVGILVGLFHLARADGVLWAVGGLLAAWLAFRRSSSARGSHLVWFGIALFVGYLLVTAAWYMRNLGEWGSLFPPGGSRALWLSEYEQTMIFPASLITPQNWLSAGWGTHLRARLDALSVIFQTGLAVQGQIILFPMILVGMWSLRRRSEVKLGGWMWGILVLAMVVLFPFASVNGSYFHSTAALQPLLWAVAPVGMEQLVLKYAGWRKIARPHEMVRFVTGLTVFTCFLLSGFLYFQRVVGSEPGGPSWSASDRHYRLIEAELAHLGAQSSDGVVVNNPPGFWLVSGRPAVVIPYGGPDMMLAVADRFRARYIILERTNPWQLGDLYHRRVDIPGIEYLSSVGPTRLYRVVTESQ